MPHLSSVHNREPSESHGRDLGDWTLLVFQRFVWNASKRQGAMLEKAHAFIYHVYLPHVNPFRLILQCVAATLLNLYLLSLAMV